MAGRRPSTPARIISGGQTGVDRAALDVALELGIACGGWCPRGRRAEDGVIPEVYPLQETSSEEYAPRTTRNVLDADATLIVTRGPLAGGSALTAEVARRAKKPCRIVDLRTPSAAASVKEWLARQRIETLNIAGPRESGCPGIYEQTVTFLRTLFA
jgi:predicted Rossmann fold nucleotide-binding protein DprA/Smf involved in DNA uptake